MPPSLDKLLETILSGALPSVPLERVRWGYGTDAPCSVCGLSVARQEAQVEGDTAERALRFHGECFEAWRDTCKRWPTLVPDTLRARVGVADAAITLETSALRFRFGRALIRHGCGRPSRLEDGEVVNFAIVAATSVAIRSDCGCTHLLLDRPPEE